MCVYGQGWVGSLNLSLHQLIRDTEALGELFGIGGSWYLPVPLSIVPQSYICPLESTKSPSGKLIGMRAHI